MARFSVRRVLTITLGVIGVLATMVVGAVVLFTQTDWGRERVRRYALEALQGAAHGRVRLGKLHGNLLTGLTVDGFSIADSSGNPLVTADTLVARYALRNFISQRLYFDDVRLVRPLIVLDRAPGGLWNYERIFPSDSTPEDTTAGPGFGSWLRVTDAEIVDGRVVVRTPWTPDSTLPAAQQDSVLRATLAGEARANVIQVAGGYQSVIELRQLSGLFPELRIADPSTDIILVRAARLRTIAAPFRPPVADIRDVAGTFEIGTDSLWFQGVRARFPNTQAVLTGRYGIETGALALRAQANPVALADLAFLYPAVPDSGGGRLDFGLDWSGPLQRYVAQNVDVRTGRTHITGQFGVSLLDSAAAGPAFELHDTDVQVTELDTRLVEQLAPGLVVPRQGLVSGRLAADGTLDTLRLTADVTFDDRITGRNRVTADGALGVDSAGVFRADALRLTVDPLQVRLATGLAASQAAPAAGASPPVRVQVAEAREPFPVAGTVAGGLVLDGSTATGLTARDIDLTHVDRGLRSRITGQGLVRLGAGNQATPYVDVALAARPVALGTVGRFAPAAGLRGVVTGPIRARGTLAGLNIDARLAVSGGGEIAARGLVDLESTEPGYDLAVDTRLFNANSLSTKAPRTSVTAAARARGRGFEPATMTLDASADVAASRVDTVGLDGATLRVNVANGMARLDTLGAAVGGAQLAASGTFGLRAGQQGELVYRLAADSLASFRQYLPRDTTGVAPRPAIVAEALRQAREDSARIARVTETQRLISGAPAPALVVDTPVVIRRDSLAGAAYAAGVVRGQINRFEVRGRAGFRRLVALGNTLKEARVEYAFTDANTPEATVAVSVRADSLLAGGFALDSVAAGALHRLNGSGTGQVAVFQDYKREYSARADYRMSAQESELRFADLRLRFDSTLWTATRPGAVRFGPRGVVVDTLELTSGPLRRIFVNGLLPTEGPADATIVVSNFEVSDALALAQSDVSLTGAVSMAARIAGTSTAPQLRGALGFAGATYNGNLLPGVRGTFDYADRRLVARAEAIAPDSLRRRLLTAEATLPVNLAFQGVTGPRLPEGQPLTARAVLDSLPLALLPQLTTAVDNLRGVATGEVNVTGSLPKPTITGALALDTAAARLVPLGVTINNIAARVRVLGDTVVIDSVAGRSGGGSMRIAGRVGITEPAKPFFNVQIRAQNARVINNDQASLRADAQIAVYGPYDSVRVSGGTVVRSGVVFLPESDGKDVQVLAPTDPAVFAVADTATLQSDNVLPEANPLVDNLQLNLNARVDRDVWVRSREANVEVYTDGDVTVRTVPGEAGRTTYALGGTVNSERGQYEFQGRRFEITRGQATLLTGPTVDAALQATAEYAVEQPGQRTLNIRLVIGGTVSQPRLTLESDANPPLTQSDLISYLAFGRSTSSLLQQQGSSVSAAGPAGGAGNLPGATAALVRNQIAGQAIGLAVDQLEKSLAESLRADVLNVTAADVPTFNPAGLVGFLKATEIEYGRYLSGRSFLGIVARPDVDAFQSTGIGLRYQYRTRLGLQIETTYQPRYLLQRPTLSAQTPNAIPVFGLFLVREWRF